MKAYYNENDKFAAQWLRELIYAGHIAPGVVDDRSIEDVTPNDLKGFTQCHFFAGIGVWSHVLRLAKWSDNRPVWTASCPCQPFSTAGKGTGFDDERHLWPSLHWLIEQCRPSAIFGEQVASKTVEPWIDLVQTDMETLDYAFGCVPFPSASVGAPNIRDRAYWVAYSDCERLQGWQERGDGPSERVVRAIGLACGMGDTCGEPGERNTGTVHNQEGKSSCSWCADGRECNGHSDAGDDGGPTPTNGFWRNADWLGCRDGKWRPVEPGTFPLVDGTPARVGRLRGYGNAVNAQAAKAFIESAYENH